MRDFSADHRWLSINTATVRKQRGVEWPLLQILQACAERGIRAVAPWRDQVAAAGLRETSRRLRDLGLVLSGYCRGGMFPYTDAAGQQAARSDNLRALDEACELGAPCLVLVAVSYTHLPVLTLAIPGSAPAAVLLAAMIIHGIKPGPMIMIENPQFVYDVVAMMFFATIGILIYGLTLTKLLVQVLRVPQHLIVPIIFVLCTVGSFAISGRLFDIWVMLAFGLIGFLLRHHGYPMAPLVLGIVLGDLLEKNLRRALLLSDGDLTPFFTRPISAFIAAAIFATVGWKLWVMWRAPGAPPPPKNPP